MRQPDRAHLRRVIRLLDRLAQRDVDGDKNGAQHVIRQHHGDPSPGITHATMLFQHFRVTGKRDIGGGQSGLVDRAGDNARDPPCLGQRNRHHDRVIGHLTRLARNFTVGVRLAPAAGDHRHAAAQVKRLFRGFDHRDLDPRCHKIARAQGCDRARSATSGPIPAVSPIVTANGG